MTTGAAVLTRMRVRHPLATLILNAVRHAEASIGDGGITLTLLVCSLYKGLLSVGPNHGPGLQRHMTQCSQAISKVTSEDLPNILFPALIRLGVFVSVASSTADDSTLPAWREATTLFVHSHLSTSLTRQLTSLLTHLVCELIAATIAATTHDVPTAAFEGPWHTAVRNLADHPPIVTVVGYPLQTSCVQEGVFLDHPAMTAHMLQSLDGPAKMMMMTAAVCDWLTDKDGTPLGRVDTFSGSAELEAPTMEVLAYVEQYSSALMKAFHQNGIRLVLSPLRMPPSIASEAVRLGMVVLHGVPSKDFRLMSSNANIIPLAELPTQDVLLSGTWECPHLHTAIFTDMEVIGEAGKTFTHIVLKSPHQYSHTLVLRTPNSLLCEEYRAMMARAFTNLSHANTLDHRNEEVDAAGVPGVWAVGGACAPWIRICLTLEDLLSVAPKPHDLHPAAAARAAARVLVLKTLKDTIVGLVGAMADTAALPYPHRHLFSLMESLKDAHKGGKCTGLVATAQSPALVQMSSLRRIGLLRGDTPLAIEAALQPMLSVDGGVLEPLATTWQILRTALSTVGQLLRIDMVLPSTRIRQNGSDSDDSSD